MNAKLTSIIFAASALPSLASACWEQAARKYSVSTDLLKAVARAESSLNPRAVNRSHFAKTKTVDIGIMQVNTDQKVLRNLGVTADQLLDPCTNIHAGARILSEKMARYGRTWEAVGAYNASCVTMTVQQCLRVRARYAWRVYRYLMAGLAPAVSMVRDAPRESIVHVRLG
jgi:soluble lytic murein transglycosylase-like protein